MSSETAPATSNAPSYSDRPVRISKEDLFMVLALWMQDFSELLEDGKDAKHQSHHQNVGAVLVLPNDILYAVDCTRDGVHGVARLLMNNHDISKGCKVFVSRKPCSFCVKLLVQSKVERVFFPPFEPEYHGVFKKVLLNLASPSGLDDFILKIRKQFPDDNHVPTENVNNINDPTGLAETFNSEPELTKLTTAVFEKLAKSENPNFKKIAHAAVKLALEEFECETSQVDTLFTRSSIGQSVFVPQVEEAVLQCEKKKCDSERPMDDKIGRKTDELLGKFWKENWMKTVKENLPWPAFDDNMKGQVKGDFENTMKWMARILVQSGLDGDEISFQEVEPNPDNGKNLDPKQAAHLLKMAQFLAGRTDDPKRGVGAVIATDEGKEIKALGWNGFPFKARYGEFPRASDDDKVDGKKYPFIIHAEQGALLYRSDKNLKGGTLFVTKTPCDECVPLIQMEGIKTVVLGAKLQRKESKHLNYLMFEKKVKEGVFTCFEKTESPPTKKKKVIK